MLPDLLLWDLPLCETLIYYSKNKPNLTKIKASAKSQCPKINPVLTASLLNDMEFGHHIFQTDNNAVPPRRAENAASGYRKDNF